MQTNTEILRGYRPKKWESHEVTPKEALDLPTRVCQDLIAATSDSSEVALLAMGNDYDPNRYLFTNVEQMAAGRTPYPCGPLLRLTEPLWGHPADSLAFATYELMGEDPPALLLLVESPSETP